MQNTVRISLNCNRNTDICIHWFIKLNTIRLKFYNINIESHISGVFIIKISLIQSNCANK